MNSSATVRALRAATLAISAGTPATVNGLLDKTAGIGESGISNATGSFASGGANDDCHAAVYAMTHSGNAGKYQVDMVFSKGMIRLLLGARACVKQIRSCSC